MLTDTERELILICARQSVPADLRQRAIEILDSDLHWEEMIATSWRHGIAPLLFQNVQLLDPNGKVPGSAMHLLRQSYVRASFRNQTHLAAVAELLDGFASAKIDIVLLKGAALAPTLYRDPALRPFADIDLLVRADKIDNAKTILQNNGYEIAPELLSENFNRRYHLNLPFVRPTGGPVHIELHWNLIDSFSPISFDHDALFARAHRASVAGRDALVLSPEDELIYLAAHLDNHGYLNRTIVDRTRTDRFPFDELSGDRLIWFTDLHELISSGALNWATVIERARDAQAVSALSVTLRLLQNLLGTKLEAHLLEALPLPRVRWPERRLGDYVLSIVDLSDTHSRARQFFRRNFLSTRRGFELRLVRLIDVWEYIFPARARERPCGLYHARFRRLGTVLQYAGGIGIAARVTFFTQSSRGRGMRNASRRPLSGGNWLLGRFLSPWSPRFFISTRCRTVSCRTIAR